MRRRACFPCAGLLLVAPVAWLAAAARPSEFPSLNEVLRRTKAYVAAYQNDLATIVAEERYEQRLESENPEEAASRTLRSDFVLVRSVDRDEWIAFRDVFEVDGQAVRDRDDRLRRLFFDPPPDVLIQARVIADESARYNLGSVVRNFNVPTAALSFLHPANASRFRFRKSRERRGEARTLWEVAYDERDRPTLIRTPDGRSAPSRGTVLIEPDSGRIVETELRVDDPASGVNARITVIFTPNEQLGLWVPAVMREAYTHKAQRTSGEATYSNYRRFRVDAKIREGLGSASGSSFGW